MGLETGGQRAAERGNYAVTASDLRKMYSEAALPVLDGWKGCLIIFL